VCTLVTSKEFSKLIQTDNMKKVTFEQFKSSCIPHSPEGYKAAKPDNAELISENAVSVLTYMGGLFIEMQSDGNYELNIENCGYVSSDLEELEKELYIWASGDHFKADNESLMKFAGDDVIELPSGKGHAYNIETQFRDGFYINGTSLEHLSNSQIRKLSKADRQLIYNTYKIDFFNV
jgi:hypothetical protein